MAPMDANLPVISVDVAFAQHFVAHNIHSPLALPSLTLPPDRSASGIGYASLKLVGNLASYPLNSWPIDGL